MFKGSIVALITPMMPNGEIDYASLQNLVQFHIEAGTHGIVSVGTTGESATLPVSEHIEVVKRTVEFAEGKLPVIAGTGANSTDEAIELGDHMQGMGVAGLLSVVPYYNKPQQRGMVAHFEAIADATDIPVLLYNVPSRTVADLLPDSVARLAEHKNIVGLKDATGDMSRLADTLKVVPEDFIMLSGDDATGCEFMRNGGHGVISVTTNIAPKLMAQMCNASAAGDFDTAAQIDAKLAELHQKIFIESNPVMPKWALHKMGFTQSANLRLPMVPPEESSQAALLPVLNELGLVD